MTVGMVSPRDVTVAFESVWVANEAAATVTRLDPATAAVQAVVPVPDPASVLSGGEGALFVTSFEGNSLTRIDPSTNRATKTISLAPAGDGPVGVVVANGYVWVANHDGKPVTSIAKVDPRTMTVVAVVPVGHDSEAGPQWVASGAGSIWTDVGNISAVVRIDPNRDTVVATIPVASDCGAEMAATGDAVWMACGTAVYRIDTHTNTVAQTIPIEKGTGALALGPDGLWFGSAPTMLGRIDPATGTVTGRMDLPGMAFGATNGGGAVWITDPDDSTLFKIDPA